MEGVKCKVHGTKDHAHSIIYVETDLLSTIKDAVNDKPSAVRWDQDIVACNLVARSHGIVEGLSLQEAMEACPGLILLTLEATQTCSNYSEEIYSVIKQFTTIIQRNSLDQYFVDVTQHPSLVDLGENSMEVESVNGCECGCEKRIRIAHTLAHQIKQKLLTINIPCRTGVSFNKTLARLASFQAPGYAFPSNAPELLRTYDLRHVPNLPLADLFRLNIRTFNDLQNANMTMLKEQFGEFASRYKRLAAGDDGSSVVVEDAWKALPVEMQVSDKFKVLLKRLLSSVEDDIKVPNAIKVYLRKFDPIRNVGNKETKVSPIPLRLVQGHLQATNEVVTRLLSIVMSMFRRLVNLSRPFHLTLLGLAFVRLPDRTAAKSVASCLLGKRDYASVQVIVDISHSGLTSDRQQSASTNGIVSKPNADHDSSPCQKKAKIDIVITKAKLNGKRDLASPSKLRVAEMNLNGSDGETTGLIINY